MNSTVTVGIVLGIMSATASPALSEVYYVLDSAVTVIPSDDTVLIQFDSSVVKSAGADFLGGHPCLDPQDPPEEIARGFWRYAVAEPCDWVAVEADVSEDATVHRVIPAGVARTLGPVEEAGRRREIASSVVPQAGRPPRKDIVCPSPT